MVMLSVNVSGLKARLSHYLGAVRNGESVLVHDRKTLIARLVPAAGGERDLQVREPLQPVASLRAVEPVRLQRGVDVVDLLLEDRQEP